jgi:GTP-binding protein HflX
VERAILVGAPRKRSAARHLLTEHLEELSRLADTAGAEVVGEVTQLLDRPSPATYLGKGKLEELRHRVAEIGATLVIFDDELSPTQGKNIELELGTRVMDRAELILDIFATRARTSEAKMQVELAQLEYMLPRLARMWTHLEKTRGGIGLRGPGETQIETDRRLIRHRIKVLRERLEDVRRSREVQRAGRRDAFKASLVGYTNAGKSSILRSLASASDIFVEDRLFATLDPLTREVGLGDHAPALVTDTVGFIRKLPHDLVASFRATLEEAADADLLLHVIDASHPTWEEQVSVVNEVLAELEMSDKPVLHVFNKIDRLDGDGLHALQERGREQIGDAIYVSAVAEGGLEPLRRALLGAIRANRPLMEVEIPVTDGRLLAEVHRTADVVDQAQHDGVLILRARLDDATAGRLRGKGAKIRAH